MNKKSKILAIILAFVFVLSCFSMSACGGGKEGAAGKSAYEIWLDEGHQGTQADFLNWLRGKDGVDGAKGDKGDAGENGTDGTQGTKGDKGDTGATGEAGAKGDKGDKGDTGAAGEAGAKGDKGDAGENGKSAYEIWLEQGYEGTEVDFLDWLRGKTTTKRTLTNAQLHTAYSTVVNSLATQPDQPDSSTSKAATRSKVKSKATSARTTHKYELPFMDAIEPAMKKFTPNDFGFNTMEEVEAHYQARRNELEAQVQALREQGDSLYPKMDDNPSQEELERREQEIRRQREDIERQIDDIYNNQMQKLQDEINNVGFLLSVETGKDFLGNASQEFQSLIRMPEFVTAYDNFKLGVWHYNLVPANEMWNIDMNLYMKVWYDDDYIYSCYIMVENNVFIYTVMDYDYDTDDFYFKIYVCRTQNIYGSDGTDLEDYGLFEFAVENDKMRGYFDGYAVNDEIGKIWSPFVDEFNVKKGVYAKDTYADLVEEIKDSIRLTPDQFIEITADMRRGLKDNYPKMYIIASTCYLGRDWYIEQEAREVNRWLSIYDYYTKDGSPDCSFKTYINENNNEIQKDLEICRTIANYKNLSAEDWVYMTYYNNGSLGYDIFAKPKVKSTTYDDNSNEWLEIEQTSFITFIDVDESGNLTSSVQLELYKDRECTQLFTNEEILTLDFNSDIVIYIKKAGFKPPKDDPKGEVNPEKSTTEQNSTQTESL